jgi:hypothetical protein
MLTLADLAKGKRLIEPPPFRQAHFAEQHFVRVGVSWEAAAAELTELFPREARRERPGAWYRLIAGTHWAADLRMGRPAQIPPGNGPFYLPEWLLEGMPESRQKEMEKALKDAKYKKVWAQALYLPPNRDYLVSIMRAAGSYLWNADPLMYRGYFYPTLGKSPAASLREYNVERWRL